jgi:hypothetical protein
VSAYQPPVRLLSAHADFEPADRDAGFIEWTFLSLKSNPVAAGIYELRFIRNLSLEEIKAPATPEMLRDAPPRGSMTAREAAIAAVVEFRRRGLHLIPEDGGPDASLGIVVRDLSDALGMSEFSPTTQGERA